MASSFASASTFDRGGLLAHRSGLGAAVTAFGCLCVARGQLHRMDDNPLAAPPAHTCRPQAWCGRSTCRRSHATLWSRWCSPRPPCRRRRPAWRRPRTGTGWRRSGWRLAGRRRSVVRAVATGSLERRASSLASRTGWLGVPSWLGPSQRPSQPAGTQLPAPL